MILLSSGVHGGSLFFIRDTVGIRLLLIDLIYNLNEIQARTAQAAAEPQNVPLARKVTYPFTECK
jgi:hypothetical protein